MKLSFACINDDENKMEQAFKFRYEIFCEEKKFFDRDGFGGSMESDLFDQHSFHFAAFDQFENIKGYARLVCHSEYGYPMQRLCPYEITEARDFIGANSAEISRFAIEKGFRACCQKTCMGATGTNKNNKKDHSDLYLAFKIQIELYRMICNACLELNITHLFAVMEKSFCERLLSRFSLRFKPIGHGFENHGTVFPFLGNISELKKSLFPETIPFFPFQERNTNDFYSDSLFSLASHGKVWA